MLSQQTIKATYGTTTTTNEVTNFLAINVPKYIIEKWQRTVDLAAQITGVSAARLIRVQPPYLKVIVASEGSNNPYQQGQQIFFNTGLYSEKVITSDKRLLIEDASDEKEYNPDLKEGMISYLGLPIHWPNGEIFGTLDLLDRKENSHTVLHDQLLQQFQDCIQNDLLALQMAERRRSEATLVAQKELFEKLVRVAKATGEQLTLEDTLGNVIEISMALTHAEHGSLFLLNKKGAVTHSINGLRKQMSERKHLIQMVMDKGAAGWVARHHEAALIADTHDDPRWVTLSSHPSTARSALILPLLRGSDLLGIMTLLHCEPEHFTAEHVTFMQAATDQIALALDNARLYNDANQELIERGRTEAQLRSSEMQCRTVSEMTSDYTFSVSVLPNGKLEVDWVTDAFQRSTGYELAEIISSQGWLKIIHPEDQPLVRRYVEKLLSGRSDVLEYRIISRSGESRWLRNYGKPEWDSQHQRVVRVLVAGQDVTEYNKVVHALKETNQELTQRVAELAQYSREISTLNEMGDFFRACRTAQEAYKVVFQTIKQLFPTEGGALSIIGETANAVETVVSWGEIDEVGSLFAAEDCWALRRGRLHSVEDTRLGLTCDHLDQHLPLSYVCVPMMAQGQALGVLHLTQTEPGKLTEAKRRLAITVAEHVGLALANLRLQETLRNQSIRDSLTGLFNRRYLEESLEREMRRAARNDSSLAIVMFDLDHFKLINDTYGHRVGDVVLREFGQLLQAKSRYEDIACRYGGEEFMLIMPDISLIDAHNRAQELLEAVRNLKIIYLQYNITSLTTSLGLAVFPENGVTKENLVRSADVALYQAKAKGRNQVVVAESIS